MNKPTETHGRHTQTWREEKKILKNKKKRTGASTEKTTQIKKEKEKEKTELFYFLLHPTGVENLKKKGGKGNEKGLERAGKA